MRDRTTYSLAIDTHRADTGRWERIDRTGEYEDYQTALIAFEIADPFVCARLVRKRRGTGGQAVDRYRVCLVRTTGGRDTILHLAIVYARGGMLALLS